MKQIIDNTNLPFRCENYTDNDKMYATEIRKHYILLPQTIQSSFNSYTSNLMNEIYINRSELIKAIDMYELMNIHKYLFPPDEWIIFSNIVYKCNYKWSCIIF